MLRHLKNVVNDSRTARKLIAILFGLVLLTSVAYPYFQYQSCQQSSLLPSPTTPPAIPGPNCFRVSYSQEELDRMCGRGSNQALCRVSTIRHINRSEFIPALLRHQPSHILMLVHPAWDLISQSILSTGAWEAHLTNFLRSSLELLPAAGLLDIGSQLGVYSLHAAQMGRQAVAIDAFYQNSIRLFASVTANGFEDRVRVYWNALALKSNGKMNMFLPGHCNIGGRAPQEKGSSGNSDPIDVRTATLNEIVIGDGCFSGVRELVVKADIEGNEWLLTETGAEVFKRFKVSLIMMEWEFIKSNPKAPHIVEFYRSHSLLPHFLNVDRLQPLKNNNFTTWPWDVIWATKELATMKN